MAGLQVWWLWVCGGPILAVGLWWLWVVDFASGGYGLWILWWWLMEFCRFLFHLCDLSGPWIYFEKLKDNLQIDLWVLRHEFFVSALGNFFCSHLHMKLFVHQSCGSGT